MLKMENGIIKMTDVEAFIIPNGAYKLSNIQFSVTTFRTISQWK